MKTKYRDQQQWREEVGDRLCLSRKAFYQSAYDAAEAITKISDFNVAQSSVASWETAMRAPVTYNFFGIGIAYNKHPAYLSGMTDDFVYPEGITQSEQEIDLIGLERNYLSKLNISPDKSRYCLMPDNGMDGIINEGELIIIDGNISAITQNGIYAVEASNRLLIRHFIIDANEKIIIKSTNQVLYPDEIIESKDLNKVLGKVKRVLKGI